MLRSGFVVAASLAAALAAPRIAGAQIEKGDTQISLFGSLSTTIGGSGNLTDGSFGGTYGYYFTRQLALRGVGFVTMSHQAGSAGYSGSTSVNAVYGGGVELNLTGSDQKFVPYLAFDGLTSGGDGGQGSVLLGPSVGARAFVSRNTAFNVAVQYQTMADSLSTGRGKLATNFGFSFFFGGDRRR